MKSIHVCAIVCTTVLLLFLTEKETLAFDLQSEINRAEKGDVISIPSGEYEGPFTIRKPITLQGNGDVTLLNKEGKYTLLIDSDHVQVHGLTIEHDHDQLELPAVLIKGDDNVVSDVVLSTSGMGIVLDKANENVLRKITIEGAFRDSEFTGSMLTREGNGIDLFQSHANLIEDITIQYAQDGIYVEQSEGNTIRNSHVAHSRYGFHFMFTKRTNVIDNLSEQNITGAMVMGTIGTHLENNRFRKQSFHVHSQGLMLYDVHDATVKNNVLEENLIGLFIESSTNNRIEGNQVFANYIGLDVLRSERNAISQNDFMNNQISARAKDSKDNHVMHNYWDDHYGLDVTGDKISAIPYDADLLFSSLIANKPAYQIFADSPGLFFLHFVLDTDRDKTLSDEAPLMEASKLPKVIHSERKTVDVIVYSLAILMSSLIIYVGGRKT